MTYVLFDLRLYGLRHVPKNGGVLIVSNHQSYLDPVLLGVGLNRPLNFIAKSELFRNPLAAWFLCWLNAFPVRQGKGDVSAVKETIHRLQAGHILNIFPEGARTPDGLIQPLQRGVSLIIKRANVPVVPVVIVGAFEAWPIHRTFFRRGPVRARFNPPLDLSGLETDEAIAEAINLQLNRMFAQLKRHTARVRAAQSDEWAGR